MIGLSGRVIALINKNRYIADYMVQYVMPQFREKLVLLDILARERRTELVGQVKVGVLELVEKIQALQANNQKKEIQCIGIHILRTEVSQRSYRLLLCAYDEQFLLDPTPVKLYMDATEFFQPLEEMHLFLTEKMVQTGGNVKETHVSLLVQQMVNPCRAYLTELSRLAAKSLEEMDGFSEIQKAENFFAICGEYKDIFDEIYVTEKETREEIQVKTTLEDLENGKENLACKVLEQYCFQGFVFAERNLSKSKIKKSKFTSSNLDRAHLVKTEFIDCCFERVTFEHAHIFDARFSGCSFYDCSFNGAFGGITPVEQNTEVVLGFTGVSFSNCTFSNVTFHYAYLAGTDFTNAKFEDVSFEEAILEQAVFSKGSIANLNLSIEQTENLILV